MARLRGDQEERLKQIASIAESEPIWSPLFLAHIGLLVFAGGAGAALYGAWWLAAIILLYTSLFALEKAFATRALERRDASRYAGVLALLTLRAVAYNVLVVVVWATDLDVFKLAALALLVAATINIMVFHATYLPIIACVVGPIWLGIAAIAVMYAANYGWSSETAAAILIVACITPYFYLALVNARDRHGQFEWAKQALNRSQRQEALGRLVAGVAHDFNNLLSVTKGNAELIEQSVSDPEHRFFAEEIVRAAERGASLTSHLLAFAGRSQLRPDHTDLRPVIEDFNNMIVRVVPERIAVSTSIAAGSAAVFVDRHQLDAALLNLAINARDAIPAAGELRIHVDIMQLNRDEAARIANDLAAGRYIRIRVTDTGSGMTQEVQQRIFDPFFTTKEAGKGSGLGLSMVSGFAKQSGGTVLVESEINQGTTVSLLLPEAEESAASKTAPAKQEIAKGCNSVLLVEDEPAVRKVLEKQLSLLGHHVSVADNGQDALALLRDGLRPDVIVTDNVMPGLVQGPDLARAADHLSPPVPTIIVSGYPEEALARLDGGCPKTQVLAKPLNRSDLADAIQSAVGI